MAIGTYPSGDYDLSFDKANFFKILLVCLGCRLSTCTVCSVLVLILYYITEFKGSAIQVHPVDSMQFCGIPSFALERKYS